MTTTQRREKFRSTFVNVPVMMLQGSVGERIKRNFTHQDPPPPLKLAGLYYTEEGHRGLDTVFHDYVQIAVKYGLPMILHPYTKLTTPSMGFSGDSYNPLTGLEEEEAYLFYTDHAKMLESSIVDHPPMFYQVNCVRPRNVMSALEEAAAGRIMSIWISWQCASVGCMMNGRYRLVRDR